MPSNNCPDPRAGGTFLGCCALGASAAAILCVMNPAGADVVVAAAQSAVTCAATGFTPCVSGTNTSSGIGVLGASNTGTGIRGSSNSTSFGVKGSSTTSYGVLGQSTSAVAGVFGSSPGTGVSGTTTGGGVGVWGSAGPAAVGKTGVGISAASDSNWGIQAFSPSGIGVRASSNTGTGLVSTSNTRNGTEAFTSDTSSGAGVRARGAYVALQGTAPPDGLALDLISALGTPLFTVDGKGNVFHSGPLAAFARTADGATAMAFTPQAAVPIVEDSGTAELIGGVAQVRLDPTFAATMDPASGYRVLLTPRADTRGLFVAATAADRFTVREAQGGRGTLGFDYRILATPLGQTGERIAPTRAAAATRPLPVFPKRDLPRPPARP